MEKSFEPPLRLLTLRFLISWALMVVVSWPVQGWVGKMASHAEVENRGKTLLAPIPVFSASDQWHKTKRLWELNPEVCVPGQTQSEFSKAECEGLKSRRIVAITILALPWMIGFLWAILVMDTIHALYRRTRRNLAVSGRVYLAQVADKRVVGQGFFGWWYGLQPVLVVQDKKKTPTLVWILESDSTPRAGQQLACVEMGHWMGRTRVLGRLYAPDVFVI